MVQPIIGDHYTAARVYFGSVVGLLAIEGLIHLPAYLRHRFNIHSKGASRHWTATVLLQKTLSYPLEIPIPYFDSYHVSDLVRFAVFATLNIIFCINTNKEIPDYTLYGFLAVANGGLALLLAARTNLFSILLRVPTPVLLQYHRWIGTAAAAEATVHVSFMLRAFIKANHVSSALSHPKISVGLTAWLSLALLLVTAIPLIRRRKFELFYYAHFLFIVFVAGAMYHAKPAMQFILPGLCLWAVDRVIRFLYNFRTVTVNAVSYYEGAVTKFELQGVRTTSPGQIVYLQVPSVSFLNWHPFTVASAPGRVEEGVTCAVRGLGGFTRRVQQLATEKSSQSTPTDKQLKVRLDGPYGVGRVEWGYHPLTILVAGGIGITPGMSIASHVINGALAGVNTPCHVYLLWVIKSETHTQWFRRELADLTDSVAQLRKNGTDVTLDVTLCVTKSLSSSETSSVSSTDRSSVGKPFSGRPDMRAWMQDIKTRHAGMDAGVNICGPRSLITETRKAVASVSGRDGIFYVEEESFEY